MSLEHHNDGDELITQGKKFDKGHIIRDGSISVQKEGKEIASLGPGAFVGEIFPMQKHSEANYTFKASSALTTFAIDHVDMNKYIQRNPRVYMNLIYFYEDNI